MSKLCVSMNSTKNYESSIFNSLEADLLDHASASLKHNAQPHLLHLWQGDVLQLLCYLLAQGRGGKLGYQLLLGEQLLHSLHRKGLLLC